MNDTYIENDDADGLPMPSLGYEPHTANAHSGPVANAADDDALLLPAMHFGPPIANAAHHSPAKPCGCGGKADAPASTTNADTGHVGGDDGGLPLPSTF